MYEHPCVKCGEKYTDSDPDAYYCPPCNDARKKIAAELDKKMGNRPKKPVVSDLQAYDAQAKIFKTPDGRTISFIKTKI